MELTKDDDYFRLCCESPDIASCYIAKLENAIKTFTKDRIPEDDQTRVLDPDVLTLVSSLMG